jgi:hypothetical protein
MGIQTLEGIMDEIPPSLHLGDFSGAISLSRQWNESKKSQNKLYQSISGNNVGLFDAKLVRRKCAGNIGPLSNSGSTIDQHPLLGSSRSHQTTKRSHLRLFVLSHGVQSLIWAKSERASKSPWNSGVGLRFF